jgi:hypothetical protein
VLELGGTVGGVEPAGGFVVLEPVPDPDVEPMPELEPLVPMLPLVPLALEPVLDPLTLLGLEPVLDPLLIPLESMFF